MADDKTGNNEKEKAKGLGAGGDLWSSAPTGTGIASKEHATGRDAGKAGKAER